MQILHLKKEAYNVTRNFVEGEKKEECQEWMQSAHLVAENSA